MGHGLWLVRMDSSRLRSGGGGGDGSGDGSGSGSGEGEVSHKLRCIATAQRNQFLRLRSEGPLPAPRPSPSPWQRRGVASSADLSAIAQQCLHCARVPSRPAARRPQIELAQTRVCFVLFAAALICLWERAARSLSRPLIRDGRYALPTTATPSPRRHIAPCTSQP